jgi:hypothetical protein
VTTVEAEPRGIGDREPRQKAPAGVPLAWPLGVMFVGTILGYAIWAAFTGHGRFIALRVGYGADSVLYVRAARAPIWSMQFLATPNGGPFLFLLLVKLCLRNLRAIVLVQSVLAAGAWLYLADTVATLLRRPWLRSVAFAVVLLVALSPQVLVWNATIATESLAVSLLATAIALSLRVATGAGSRSFVALLVVFAALACTRDTNIGLLLLIALFAGVVALTRAPVRRRALAIVAVCIVAAGVNIGLSSRAHRWYHPLTETIVLRMFGSPTATEYFVAHGMPYDQKVRNLHTHYVANLEALYSGSRFGPFRTWIADHGRSTYADFLATHPGWTFGKPYADRKRLLAPELPYGVLFHDDPRGAFHVIGAVAFPSNMVLVEVWIGAGLIAGVMLVRQRRFRGVLVVLGGSAVLVVAGFLAAWHGDALEIERHSLGATVQLRVVLWIVALMTVDTLFARTATRSVEVRAEPEPREGKEQR